MLKPMNVRRLTRRHICSMKGCGNRDTVLVARSQDLYGGTYICRDCVAALADHFGIAAEAEKESTSGNANEAPVNENKAGGDDAAEAPKETKTGKSASKRGEK